MGSQTDNMSTSADERDVSVLEKEHEAGTAVIPGKEDDVSGNGAADHAGDGERVVGETNTEYITGMKLALVLASLTLVYFLIMLDNTILATAIPYITDEFHSLLDVGWYASAYTLCSAALQPLGGKVYERLDSKWSFVVYLVLFEIGSAVCGAAQTSTMLIGGRALAGIGGSGLLNGALVILNSVVPPHQQPALLGVLMAIGQLGIAFGPLIGGALTEYASWRWCFYINLPVGAVGVVLIILIHIPNHVEKPRWQSVVRRAVSEFDLIGFALFAPAAIMFFLALQYGGNQFAWGSATVIGLFCGAGGLFIVWIVWDYYRGDSAMVPFSMLSNQVVWSSSAYGLFYAGSLFIAGYYLPIYFQSVRGASPLMSGVDVLPNILAMMIFGLGAGAALQQVGYYLPFVLIGAAVNIIGTALSGLFAVDTPTGQWIGYQIIFGAARGLAMSSPFLAVQNAVPKVQMPAAMSTLMFSQNFGGAVMIVFAQTIFTNGLRDLIPEYAPGVDVEAVILAGGTKLRTILTPEQLPGVLEAIAKTLSRINYFAAGLAGASLICAAFMGWVDIRIPVEVRLEGKTDAPQEKTQGEQAV